MMMNYIDYTLNNLKLSKNGYGVIHIRTGDKYLVNKASIDINFVNRITKLLKKNIKQMFKINKNNKVNIFYCNKENLIKMLTQNKKK